MRRLGTRQSDATFDLNLAPMLDIIVTVIPMLLLSLAFVQVKMIETPVPQMTTNASTSDQKPTLTMTLKMNKQTGFTFVVNDHGKVREVKVPLVANGQFDQAGLVGVALQMKRAYPDRFRLELEPGATVSMNEIVATVDAVRKGPEKAGVFSFKDEKTGKLVQTDLMFPDVVFSNVAAE
jgi:biopolymer transport protein ExbD